MPGRSATLRRFNGRETQKTLEDFLPGENDDTATEPGQNKSPMARRFRGFLPVIVDVETGGFNAQKDALLELAACTLRFNADGLLEIDQQVHFHVEPFPGANIEEAALAITGIKPFNPLRAAVKECDALGRTFKVVRTAIKESGCTRAVLVGHNAHFDQGFLNAAVERCGIKRNPFHPFSVFDTATLGGAVIGQTVLRRAVEAAGFTWDESEAHSARYDTERTAQLFCHMINALRPVYEAEAKTSTL